MLPPLISGQAVNQKNGHNISNHQGYNPSYHAGYRPSKLRSLNNKPGMVGGHQVLSGERIRLNQHGSQEKLSNYSGNYGSPGNADRRYDENQQYIDNIQAQLHQVQRENRRAGGTKIGSGVLNKKNNISRNPSQIA